MCIDRPDLTIAATRVFVGNLLLTIEMIASMATFQYEGETKNNKKNLLFPVIGSDSLELMYAPRQTGYCCIGTQYQSSTFLLSPAQLNGPAQLLHLAT